MKQRFVSVLFLLIIVGCKVQAKVLMSFAFQGSTVELLDSVSAAAENIESDPYTKALTPFDLQIRLGKESGAVERDYLNRAASQVCDWPQDEQEQLKKSFEDIASFLQQNNIKLNLPRTIELIKTNGKEEFEAEGYTRANRIMLHTSDQQKIDVHLVAHELFHVFSRYNEGKRDAIYALFGFKKCYTVHTGKAMEGRVITNPDCPVTEHYITVKQDDKTLDLVLQLYSKAAYQPHYTLNDYVNIGLLEVAGKGMEKSPVLKDNKGVILDLDKVPDFFTQVGTNTPYLLHPEEISAEHFSMWIAGTPVHQPEYFVKIKNVLGS